MQPKHVSVRDTLTSLLPFIHKSKIIVTGWRSNGLRSGGYLFFSGELYEIFSAYIIVLCDEGTIEMPILISDILELESDFLAPEELLVNA